MAIPNWLILGGMGAVFVVASVLAMLVLLPRRQREKRGFPIEPGDLTRKGG